MTSDELNCFLVCPDGVDNQKFSVRRELYGQKRRKHDGGVVIVVCLQSLQLRFVHAIKIESWDRV